MSRLLILGCRPTLANVEAEVTAIAATAPGAELLLDPTAALAGQRTPHHSWCHFAGHADPKLGPDRVLVMCHDGGFGAVDASTLVDMLRTMKLVVLNGCKSEELGLKLREAGVPNVVVWKTLLYDPAAKLFAVRFWEIMTARSPNDNDSLRTAVRAAFEAAKLAVQTAVRPGGALDVGGGKTRAAAVPAYELHDPEDAATVEQKGPNRVLLPTAGAEKAGRNAAGVPLLLQQPATVHGVPPRPDHYEPRPDVEGSVRKALLGAPQATLAIAPTGLCGTAGLGKTTLATWLALDAEVQAFFADGVFWLRFGQEATALAKLQELAGALGMPLDDSRMRDVQPAVAALQARLSGAGTHHLVILDDVWVKEQVSPFKQLCNSGTVALVLTTRLKELAQRFGQPQALEPLDEVRARSMLARCLQRPEAELEANDDFQKLLRRSCGLPIMLESLANMCSGQTPGDVLKELEAARAEMEKLEARGAWWRRLRARRLLRRARGAAAAARGKGAGAGASVRNARGAARGRADAARGGSAALGRERVADARHCAQAGGAAPAQARIEERRHAGAVAARPAPAVPAPPRPQLAARVAYGAAAAVWAAEAGRKGGEGGRLVLVYGQWPQRRRAPPQKRAVSGRGSAPRWSLSACK
jgi:hypothetical protein